MTSMLIGLICLVFIVFSVGSASAFFLFLLDHASKLYARHNDLIFLLPFLGLTTGLIYSYFGKKILPPQKLLSQAHDQEASIPIENSFLIFIFTILSQAFGASTGRESTAIQFGAGLAEFWSTLFKKTFRPLPFSRQAFIRSGLAAGFGAVFGVPWAGAIFALEVTPNRRWPLRFLGTCLISSFGAHRVALAWGAQHKIYPKLISLNWGFWLSLKWIALGFAFGVSAKIFIVALKNMDDLFVRRVRWSWLRPAIGGGLILLLTTFLGSHRYNGLGLELIQDSLTAGIQSIDFIWKSVFTIISSASGLKGGEVTPLMAIGASLGAVLSTWLALPSAYSASLGLVSVFASCAHIQWTGAIMAWELFGVDAFLPAFVVCWVAQKVVGTRGLYVTKD